MNNLEIIDKLKLALENTPEEISVNMLIKGSTANKVNFISQLMQAENPDFDDETIYQYIFWNGANKVLEDLANNVSNDNSES